MGIDNLPYPASMYGAVVLCSKSAVGAKHLQAPTMGRTALLFLPGLSFLLCFWHQKFSRAPEPLSLTNVTSDTIV